VGLALKISGAKLGGAWIGRGARLPNDLKLLATDFHLSRFRVSKADSRAEPFLWCRFAERMNNYNLATLTVRLGEHPT
jgi:hypothetical protein